MCNQMSQAYQVNITRFAQCLSDSPPHMLSSGTVCFPRKVWVFFKPIVQFRFIHSSCLEEFEFLIVLELQSQSAPALSF